MVWLGSTVIREKSQWFHINFFLYKNKEIEMNSSTINPKNIYNEPLIDVHSLWDKNKEQIFVIFFKLFYL